jgi:hypothetical protein
MEDKVTQQKKTFPGIVRSVKEYPEAPKVPKRRTIEEKRQTVIRGIEQHLKGQVPPDPDRFVNFKSLIVHILLF